MNKNKQTVIIYDDPFNGCNKVYDSTGKNRYKVLQLILKSITRSFSDLKKQQDDFIRNIYAPQYIFNHSNKPFDLEQANQFVDMWRKALEGNEDFLDNIFQTFSNDLDIKEFRYIEETVKTIK